MNLSLRNELQPDWTGGCTLNLIENDVITTILSRRDCFTTFTLFILII